MPVQAVVEMANRVDLGGAHAHPDLREALLAVAAEKHAIDVRRLGKWLSKNEDRVIDRHKITRSDIQTSAVRWFITAVS
jgi:hypothetical protein